MSNLFEETEKLIGVLKLVIEALEIDAERIAPTEAACIERFWLKKNIDSYWINNEKVLRNTLKGVAVADCDYTILDAADLPTFLASEVDPVDSDEPSCFSIDEFYPDESIDTGGVQQSGDNIFSLLSKETFESLSSCLATWKKYTRSLKEETKAEHGQVLALHSLIINLIQKQLQLPNKQPTLVEIQLENIGWSKERRESPINLVINDWELTGKRGSPLSHRKKRLLTDLSEAGLTNYQPYKKTSERAQSTPITGTGPAQDDKGSADIRRSDSDRPAAESSTSGKSSPPTIGRSDSDRLIPTRLSPHSHKEGEDPHAWRTNVFRGYGILSKGKTPRDPERFFSTIPGIKTSDDRSSTAPPLQPLPRRAERSGESGGPAGTTLR